MAPRKPKAKPPATLALAPHLDLPAAAPLAGSLLALRGEPVSIDASAVERLGGQCLQVLLSAVVTWKADMVPLAFSKPSGRFTDGLRLLGFTLDELTAMEPAR